MQSLSCHSETVSLSLTNTISHLSFSHKYRHKQFLFFSLFPLFLSPSHTVSIFLPLSLSHTEKHIVSFFSLFLTEWHIISSPPPSHIHSDSFSPSISLRDTYSLPSLSLTDIHSLSLSHFLSLSFTVAQFISLSLPLSQTHTQSLSFPLFHRHSLSLSLFLT